MPAANLKTWLEGAGFWDIRQLVMHLPIGGDSTAGKLLLDFLEYQTDHENFNPLVRLTECSDMASVGLPRCIFLNPPAFHPLIGRIIISHGGSQRNPPQPKLQMTYSTSVSAISTLICTPSRDANQSIHGLAIC